jgi:hypothetical protein
MFCFSAKALQVKTKEAKVWTGVSGKPFMISRNRHLLERVQATHIPGMKSFASDGALLRVRQPAV